MEKTGDRDVIIYARLWSHTHTHRSQMCSGWCSGFDLPLRASDIDLLVNLLLIQAQISQQLLDGLPWNFVHLWSPEDESTDFGDIPFSVASLWGWCLGCCRIFCLGRFLSEWSCSSHDKSSSNSLLYFLQQRIHRIILYQRRGDNAIPQFLSPATEKQFTIWPLTTIRWFKYVDADS